MQERSALFEPLAVFHDNPEAPVECSGVSQATGGVRLAVAAQDAQRARDILASSAGRLAVVPQDDDWDAVTASIELDDAFDESALDGLDTFSHAEILFVFHQVSLEKIVPGARHPRNNPAWPKVGIFAQRGKNRPNRIGTTIVPILLFNATA